MCETRLQKMDDWLWEIPLTGGMCVPWVIYTSEKLTKRMGADQGPKQVTNVAHLPRIVTTSLAMLDMH